jgi:N-acetylneuraminate synthase
MTVCDEWCVEIMDEFDFDVYKVASYEIAHLPMLEAIAQRDKAIFVSTGAATMDEVREAVHTLSPDGKRPLGLFQCTAKYPAPEEALDLAVIPTFAENFPQIIPGFSDHSFDPVKAPVQAIYHGAKMIEKHFTLDRNLPGVDQSFAAEPQHLRELIREVREAEARMAAGEAIAIDPVLAGRSAKVVEEDEQVLRGFATRGIFAIETIRAGEPFTRENLRVLRPGELQQGLHPREFARLTDGGVAARDIPQWMGLQPEDVRQ